MHNTDSLGLGSDDDDAICSSRFARNKTSRVVCERKQRPKCFSGRQSPRQIRIGWIASTLLMQIKVEKLIPPILIGMIEVILVAANMCLLGGEQIDVSHYVPPTASALKLKATLSSATGTLLVYSPGYEDHLAQFDKEHSLGVIPIAEPVLCVKAVWGPFEFNIDIMPTEDAE